MTSYESEDMATTPRPNQTTFGHTPIYSTEEHSSLKTPTRDSFQPYTGQMSSLDTSNNVGSYETTAHTKPRKVSMERSTSLRSGQSAAADNITTNMDEDMNDASDNDSATSDGRPQKKKKGQKFYCVDFPPCHLSFTRSEHLARHIRKHTGERPFQCHCLRRFSRLDNLRQHAQTVHLNEDIPQDSLAATGTRFQRQIRTDRVRAPGGRARASTLGSQSSGQSRAHSRNISTSSIASASDFGSMDQASQQQHGPGQAQPLAMGPPPATPSRGGLSLDTYGAGAGGPEHPYYPFYPQNTGYSSPNPIYPIDPTSPLAHTGLQSPIAMVPRGVTWVQPLQARRMSVPSGAAPFQSPSSYGSAMSYMSPFGSSNASAFSNSSMITSPTNSTFSDHNSDLAAEVEHRRRTWHLGHQSNYEQRPATSGLSYYQTPDAPKPMPSTQAAAAQNSVRLPGIDSFDRGGGKSASAQAGPMDSINVDNPTNQQFVSEEHPFAIPGAQMRAHPIVAAPQRRNHQYTKSAPQSLETAALEMQAQSSNVPMTPRKQKRNAWYNGPLPSAAQQQETHVMATSPANSSGSEAPHTPSAMSVTDFQPAIIHSNGFVEPLPPGIIDDPSKVPQLVHASRSLQQTMQPQQIQDYSQNRHRGDMDRLDALVAVATSENQTTKT